ncbi:MAG: UDP-N-acetylmuramoyl-tripeptide--D-alanyl-D-alanine ligase [Flavobacteriaceae bacterium]
MSTDKLYDYFYNSKSVSIDSRTVQKGDIYFALKGERFDGNKFAKDAIKNGASFAVIDDHSLNHPNFLKVESSLKALQELSKFHRSKLVKTKIIALTGSNGKTTTKELIREVLKTQYKVCSTEGNLNNHIGVPLTLLKINPKADFAIIEMGANHLKEIEFLTRLINPDFGLITNFGKAHLEGFGSLEGVIKGKSELYDYLKKNNKIAFVNADDDIQNKFSGQKIAFSSNKKGLYNFKKNDSSRMSSLIYKNEIVKSNLTGKYNYSNIGFATLIGLHFKISINAIKKAILNYVPSNNRSQIISKDNKSIILDAYNANPTSMAAALNSFSELNGDKTVILGDMFELGKGSSIEHKKIIDFCIENKFESIFFIGEEFYKHKNKFKIPLFFKNKSDFYKYTKEFFIKTENILIKGSRGMKLEEILNKF